MKSMHHLDEKIFDILEDGKSSSEQKLLDIKTTLEKQKEDLALYQEQHKLAEKIAKSNEEAGIDAKPDVEPLPNINAVKKGETALFVAVRLKEAKIAEELINRKADLTVKDNRSCDLLSKASENGDITTLQLLMKRSETKNFKELMLIAIKNKQRETIKYLLETKEYKYTEEDGVDFLCEAVSVASDINREIIEDLLQFGFDPVRLNSNSDSPLMKAVSCRFHWAAEKFLNCANKSTNTSEFLDHASHDSVLDTKHVSNLAPLATEEKKPLGEENYINLLNRLGHSALDLAIYKRDYALILLLLTRGANLANINALLAVLPKMYDSDVWFLINRRWNLIFSYEHLGCFGLLQTQKLYPDEFQVTFSVSSDELSYCREIYNFLINKKAISDTELDKTQYNETVPNAHIMLNLIHADQNRVILNETKDIGLISNLFKMTADYAGVPHDSSRYVLKISDNKVMDLFRLRSACLKYLKHIRTSLKDETNNTKIRLGRDKETAIEELLKTINFTGPAQDQLDEFYKKVDKYRPLLNTCRSSIAVHIGKVTACLLTGGIGFFYQLWRPESAEFLKAIDNLKKGKVIFDYHCPEKSRYTQLGRNPV